MDWCPGCTQQNLCRFCKKQTQITTIVIAQRDGEAAIPGLALITKNKKGCKTAKRQIMLLASASENPGVQSDADDSSDDDASVKSETSAFNAVARLSMPVRCLPFCAACPARLWVFLRDSERPASCCGVPRCVRGCPFAALNCLVRSWSFATHSERPPAAVWRTAVCQGWRLLGSPLCVVRSWSFAARAMRCLTLLLIATLCYSSIIRVPCDTVCSDAM